MKILAIRSLLACALLCTVAHAPGSGLDPALLLQQPTNSWPTYNGDYSGRRFSTLTKINDSNVKSLSLSWMYQIRSGSDPSG